MQVDYNNALLHTKSTLQIDYTYLVWDIFWQIIALTGWVGSIRIYLKWHYGEPVIGLIRGWGGALLFAGCVLAVTEYIIMHT